VAQAVVQVVLMLVQQELVALLHLDKVSLVVQVEMLRPQAHFIQQAVAVERLQLALML
jgi:hypothetical protein